MKIFSFARLKLTAWYVLVISVVSLTFSAVIYRLEVSELLRFQELQRQRIESRYNNAFPGRGPFTIVLDEELTFDIRERMLFRLGVANGIIIVVSAGLGFFLAGKTLAPIEKMVKEQERFVSDASHELKTPLTSLRTSIEVFLRDKKPTLKEAKNLLKDNLNEVVRLQRLSDSLLKLTLFGKQNYFLETVALDELITKAVARLAPLSKTKQIKLSTKLLPLQMQGQPDQLEELITILVENAIKYSPAKTGRVSLKMTKTHKHAVIEVKDNGLGISPEHLPHIFERFFRADNSRSRTGETGGYGLGLSIAKQIVSDHHGQLTVASKEGKGSTFTVTLPL